MGPIDTLTGQSFNVSGRLLPGKPGRIVKLQAGTGHGWQTLTTARTRANGHFELHYGAGNTGGEQVRLAFPGDRQNRNVSTRSVTLNVYRTSVASWYDDGGATACGFHAGMGVANKSLPCGTKVTFHYNGRSVTAVVDDRGPFAGGREWDLNQNVAGALGFGGVDTVWSSV
jgi:rare lipoprotein A (peptidoglycan hydrolase)